jgi:hypothetical protein
MSSNWSIPGSQSGIKSTGLTKYAIAPATISRVLRSTSLYSPLLQSRTIEIRSCASSFNPEIQSSASTATPAVPRPAATVPTKPSSFLSTAFRNLVTELLNFFLPPNELRDLLAAELFPHGFNDSLSFHEPFRNLCRLYRFPVPALIFRQSSRAANRLTDQSEILQLREGLTYEANLPFARQLSLLMRP